MQARSLGFFVALLALALTWGVPRAGAGAAPAQAPKSPPSPAEQIKADLLDIQNHITNANMRLHRNFAGMSQQGAPREQTRRTLAETCCSINLDAIAEKSQHLSGTIDQLDAHFARQRDSTALDNLKEMRIRLTVVNQGLVQFRMAGTTERAKAALDGLILPFIDLRTASEELEACCALPGAPGKPAAPAPAAPRRGKK